MTDDRPLVRLVGPPPHPAVVTFSDYVVEDKYHARYRVTISADGLDAAVTVIDGVEGNLLPDLIAQLAEDFRGWEGTRSWRALEDQLRVTARWRSLGHIELTIEIRPNTFRPWTATATAVLDAGEDARRAAADLRALQTP